MPHPARRQALEQGPVLAGYRPPTGGFDELLDAEGRVRPVWRQFMEGFAGLSEAELKRVRTLADRADHKFKAARLLAAGGFVEAAQVPAVDAVCLTSGSLAAMTTGVEPGNMEEAVALLAGLEPGGEADGVALDAMRVLYGDTEDRDPVETAAAFFDHVSDRISRMTLSASIS